MMKLIFLTLLLTGCAASEAYRDEKNLLEPGPEHRAVYLRQKEAVINKTLTQAESKLASGSLDDARGDFNNVIKMDANNSRAARGLEQIAASIHAKSLASEAKSDTRDGLGPQFNKEVSFSFRDAPISSVFDALVHATGINFIFDKDVKTETRTSMTIKQKAMVDVLKVILSMNQMSHRVLDENTILIYPNTEAKSDDYQELIIRNFYLSHSNVQQTANMLKSMVKAKEIFVDERLNLIVMKDTREAINLAEKLISTQDLPEPEVMLELEVLEIASNKMRDLGIRWPDQISGSVTGAAGVRGELNYEEFRNPSKGLVSIQVNNPLITATLRQLDGDASLLANPRIRIKNRAKANILIGERVPVVTTTTTANVGTSESVNYLDVGLKLNLEPVISLDQQVSMNVSLEVSNILDTITRASGLQTYRLGTRNASTVLRVKDGETQILAGLIQQDERNSAQRVPFLGDFPVLGRLFSSTSENGVKTEIVLLITPRIIRNIPLPLSGKSEIFSGTRNSLGADPMQLKALSKPSITEDHIEIPNSPPSNDQQGIFIPPMPGVAQ